MEDHVNKIKWKKGSDFSVEEQLFTKWRQTLKIG